MKNSGQGRTKVDVIPDRKLGLVLCINHFWLIFGFSEEGREKIHAHINK